MLSTKEPQEQPTHAGVSLETGDNHVRWTLSAPSSDPQQKEPSRAVGLALTVIGICALGMGVFFYGAFFGFNGVSLAILASGLPLGLFLLFFVKARLWGNTSPHQEWFVHSEALEHTYVSGWGQWKRMVYEKENIKRLAFFPDHFLIELHEAQGGFSTRIMRSPVLLSQETLQTLVSALREQGIKAVC